MSVIEAEKYGPTRMLGIYLGHLQTELIIDTLLLSKAVLSLETTNGVLTHE